MWMMSSVKRRYQSIGMLATLVILVACDSPQDPGTGRPTASVLNVSDLGVLDQDSRLLGRDGGYSGLVDNEQVWVFGDSVVTDPDSNAVTWLSSSYSVSTDLDVADGVDVLDLMNDDTGQPVELLTFTEEVQYNLDHQGENCIDPCGARWALWPDPLVRDEARQRTLLLYGKIHAEPGEFNFYGVGQSIAIWETVSAKPIRANVSVVGDHPTLLFGADEPQFGPGSFAYEDYLYSYACEIDDFVKPCKLARTPLADVIDKSAWEYFNTGSGWTKSQAELSILFQGNDIMSVSYNNYLEAFVAVYSEPLSRNIKLRTAPNPQGPWSSPVPVAEALASGNTNGWVYDALAHPEYSTDDGRTLHITYTRDVGAGVREMRLLEIVLSKTPDL